MACLLKLTSEGERPMSGLRSPSRRKGAARRSNSPMFARSGWSDHQLAVKARMPSIMLRRGRCRRPVPGAGVAGVR